MSKKMTPCEKLGYKVGDMFEVISHYAFKKGQVVTLHEDDGTECPLFAGDGGGAGAFDGVECSFATLNKQVRKIANKLKPAKQSLADAINQNGGWVEGGDWHKSGELPPVGTFVDVVGDSLIYGQGESNCEVIAHVENTAVIRMSYGLGCFESGAIIPARTEREKAIDEMVCEFIDHHGDPKGGERYLGIAAKLYDAGYRKEVK